MPQTGSRLNARPPERPARGGGSAPRRRLASGNAESVPARQAPVSGDAVAILDVERGRAAGPFAQTAAQARYAAFREALNAVAERIAGAADVAMLTSVHATLTDLFGARQSHDEAELQVKIGDLRGEIEAHRERERALLAAALSAEQIASLAEQLALLGLTDLALGEQRNGGDLIAHVIEARRPQQ